MNSFFAFFLLTGSLFALDVEVSCPSAILMNAETGNILYEKNAHLPRHPASVTKIGTLLYILDQKEPKFDEKVQVSAEALRLKPAKWTDETPSYWGEIDGTKMGLLKGEVLSIDSLLHGLVLVSGNDSANVLAESLSPSIPHFISELNAYLQKIGCSHTYFCNPHGLHHDLHVTTAYEICLMMQKGLQIPKFREILATPVYMRPKTNKQKAQEMVAINPLSKRGQKRYDARVIGGKTGYHSKAGYNLVAAAEEKGRTLIAVLLGGSKRTDRYEDAKRLFDAAFQEALVAETLFTSAHIFSYPMEGAEQPLKASLKEDLAIAYFPSEKQACRAHVHWDSLELPISQGQRVGEVRISDPSGKVIQVGEIAAKEAVHPTWTTWLKNIFRKKEEK